MLELKINYHYMNQCDMNCKFCFGKMNGRKNDKEILDTFDSLTVVTKSINLAGGEPFSDIDLLYKLVKKSLERRITLSIITNGLILSQSLADSRVDYILRHIKKIGISVDSFNVATNKSIGRIAKNGNSLTPHDLEKIVGLCRTYRTKVKINTVVSRANVDEEMGGAIESIKPDVWKLIEVVSTDDTVKVSREEYKEFLDSNKHGNNITEEPNDNTLSSYIMINSKGNLYYNEEFYPDINLNTLVEEHGGEATKAFKEMLRDNGISLKHYMDRYGIEDYELNFNKSKYHKKLGKYFKHSKRSVMLLDVESITARPHQMKRHKWLNGCQVHVLYTGLVINSKMEIIEQFSDYVEPGIDISKNLEKSKSNPYQKFFRKFVDKLLNVNPRTILVSGIDTERNFLMDAIYYTDLRRREYEKIQKYTTDLTDIQTIKRKEILYTGDAKSSSRKVLDELNSRRPDLFLYKRREEKKVSSSGKVSDKLLEVFHSHHDKSHLLLSRRLEDFKEYCLDDVYDDYELLFSYEMINRAYGEILK